MILVTHAMTTVEEYCHRAMLIDDGVIQHLGDPAEVGRHYLQVSFERGADGGQALGESDEVRLRRAWIEDESGAKVASVENGVPIRLRAEIEARRELPGISVGFIVSNADGVNVVQFGVEVEKAGGVTALAAGERVMVSADIENMLRAGRYYIHTGVNRVKGAGGVALYVHNSVDFVVFGGDMTSNGVVQLPIEISAEVKDGAPR